METNLDSHKAAETFSDRRRHPRYRFSEPIKICSTDGVVISGIGIEFSESGMSAITAESLKVDDIVKIELIGGGTMLAVVRRNIGRISGFEFLNVTAEQGQRIRDSCKVLPLYRDTSLGI
jgi:PilZ domain